MPVTITGGVTITGTGVTMFGSSPAPTASTAGWFGGGYAPAGNYSTVDRLTFATDTAVATVRGPLSLARYGFAGSGTSTNGWFSGGQTSTVESTIDRITYSNDTATASVRGPLSSARRYASSVSDNSTYSWIGGGIDLSLPGIYSSQVARIVYATDTATTTNRGPLSIARFSVTSIGTTQYGWNMGGYEATASFVSTVDRITYSNDTATASVRGPLTGGKYKGSTLTDSTTYGWFAGGSSPVTSIVNRVTYATDTTTASTRGPLSVARASTAGVYNNTSGWVGAGYSVIGVSPQVLSSSIDRITYATDTATATTRGSIGTVRVYPGSSSGVQ
jgi:hypothetical protein